MYEGYYMVGLLPFNQVYVVFREKVWGNFSAFMEPQDSVPYP